MPFKLLTDTLVMLLSYWSLHEIYVSGNQTQLSFMQLNPILLCHFLCLLISCCYFLCLRHRTILECLNLIQLLRTKYHYLSKILISIVGIAFIASMRFEHRMEYVQIGHMQILTEFRFDRWNDTIQWVAPSNFPDYQGSAQKSWSRFPVENFSKDIEGVWYSENF